MKLITLENVSDANVTEYPIAEPELVNGEVKYDDNGSIKSTGKTLLWTINSGEKKAFPEYVAKVLLNRYGVEDPDKGRSILEVVEGIKDEEVVGESKGDVCQHCGVEFKGIKGKALHYAAKHPELLK